jgi:4-amino-4-deoxy-L-arabinose transferase-like glycosyltransferase
MNLINIFNKSLLNENKGIIRILILTISVRILFLITFSDLTNLRYYEYGEIVKNIHNGNGYSLFYFENDSLKYKYNPEAAPFRSAYMPPGYSMFLFPFFFINNENFRSIFILLVQIIISGMNAFFLYKLTCQLFTKKVGMIAALIYSLLPEFIYASANINIVTLYHTGILLFFYLLVQGKISISYSKLTFFILTLISLIYLRFEFIVFILVISIFLYKQIGIKKLGLIYIAIILALSPWLIRNYLVFDHFPLLSTSTGLNLYRGHNDSSIGDWNDEKLDSNLISLKNNPRFEYESNRIYARKATSFIFSHPGEELKYSVQKIFQLWVFNQDDKRTDNLFYKIPSLLILITFLIGLLISFSFKKYKYFYMFFIFFTLISIAFFALPRYQTMLKIAFLPFVACLIEELWKKLKVMSIS